MTAAATIPALAEIRRRAAELFEARGFPTTREEEWRFTNVSSIGRARLPIAPPSAQVHSLRAALEQEPEIIEEHLARYASCESNPFVALNTSNFEDGAFVHIPANTIVEEPVWLDFKAVPGRTTHPRNLIVIGAGSQIRLVERYTGAGKYFTNAVTEIVVGQNAVVEHIKLEEESLESFHVATIQVRQARNSNFKSHNISFGGGLVRNDVNAVLSTGCEGTLNGLYLTNFKQHVDNHTALDHAAHHAVSHELYKGILDGASSAVFNGKIFVRKDAQKTDAKQTNKNLVLSENAVINTKPELQILADDVRCTHGATVGQLDQEALFYLRARGIDKRDARDLLIYAFARDVIHRIGVAGIQTYLEKALFSRLIDSRRLPEVTS
ncbi:MAG TPA: Fe-S cluster assembly protein SufD [Bryobacteraceae bacterium]|jgi:Fe-S cluster assembly protein SufD|nr:Fe-S cluster assembly protein SufD [Bryobacteraceae bacterium]